MFAIFTLCLKAAALSGHALRPDTAFKQQRMPAIQPIVTPAWAVGLFMTIGVFFVPLGAWLKLEYADVVELSRQYEGPGRIDDDCSISTANEGREVILGLSVPEEITGLSFLSAVERCLNRALDARY